MKFGFDWYAFSEKIKFNILYVKDLIKDSWPRSGNDFNLEYSHTFRHSISLYLPTFMSQATKLHEDPMFSHILIEKCSYETKIDL